MSFRNASPTAWIGVFALLVAIRALALFADPTVRYFLGDSATYIHASLAASPPVDRSATYPLLIRAIALPARSLVPLLVFQAACGVGVALVAFAILRDAFALDARIAAALAVLAAIGPEQLFYERMVMAEAAGLLAFAIMLACGFAFVRRGRWPILIGIAAAGIASVSFRLSLLPIVLGFAPLPPLMRWIELGAPRGRAIALCAANLAIVIIATLGAHALYKRWYGDELPGRPDYIAYSGYFRLGLVAPLVEPRDLEGLGLPPGFLDRIEPPYTSRFAREAQIWAPEGLASSLRNALGDVEGNRAASRIALRALRRDPAGLVRLGVETLGDYFGNRSMARMADDLGRRAPSAEFAADLATYYGDPDATASATRETLVYRYFRASRIWLTACLFGLPLLAIAAAVAAWRTRVRASALLLAATSLGVFVAEALFSHIVSYRYLHAFPLLVWLNAGALLASRSVVAAVDPESR
ncbi:MAG: hypothetical protein ABW186_01780 [Rhodanobacteraceae bacterium]